MANLFDQYEEAAAGRRSLPSQHVRQPISSGYVTAALEDEVPIFSKQKINFNPPDVITHMCVGNNYLVLAMKNNVLLRIHLDNPDKPDEVELKHDDKISGLFLDPTGHHMLLSTSGGDSYYLARGSKKTRSLPKLKGYEISAVGWNKQSKQTGKENSTGEILLGTTKGIILETEIQSAEDGRFFSATLEQYFKQHLTISKERAYPITGLRFEKVPVSAGQNKYFVLITLPGRLYQYVGNIPSSAEGPMFQHVFAKYEDTPERFIELPGNFGYSRLQFFHPKYSGLPKTFAWMTGPGIFHGEIDVTGAAGQDAVIVETKLVTYPYEDEEQPSKPLDIVLTDFHILVLFRNRLKAICVLNEQLIYDDVYNVEKYGRLCGMCRDPIKGTIWAFTNSSVFKYKVVKESRDVWQMYLDKGEFHLAREYCKDNPAHLDKVLTKQAERYFQVKKYEESAAIYAKTQNSFEEIVLKFIKLEEKDALKTFLMNKLDSMKEKDKTEITMLSVWLVEIFLNQLGNLREAGQDVSDVYHQLQESFRHFLHSPKIKDVLDENRGLVYELIASHGDIEDMVFFAVLMKDYERVITHHLQHDQYDNALDVLAKQNNWDLFYKFSPILMQNIPKLTVDAWISKRNKLDAKKLIPALVQYDHDKYRAQDNEAIRYLEFCVQSLGMEDTAIHNYLLSLYARLQPQQLLTYLHFQGHDPDLINYDVKYALRLCAEYNHKEARVHIYSTMGLYEEAVDLALQVDVELAKQNADKPEDDEELRKKLWLKIARHVVEKESDIKRAMEFLHECDLLKIEDILPFFPDFVTIDHFKDAICTSLQEYNQHIDSLKDEMEEATDSAREIRGEITSFRNKFAYVKPQDFIISEDKKSDNSIRKIKVLLYDRFAYVKPQDKCSCCGFPLMSRSFYVFPCQHRFHNDCLISEVVPHLTSSTRTKVEELQRVLASREQTPSPIHSPKKPGTLTAQLSHYSVKEELDDIIAAECVYCGDVMIRGIDRAFIEEDEFDSVMQGWT